MSTFIVTAETPLQERALKALLKALEMPYKAQKEERPYNPEFVAKIERAEKQISEGKYTVIDTADLWK